jgi:hypothetical protein
MEYKLVLASIALIFGLFQYVPYLIDVIRNKTKPHAFSWFAWSLPTAVVFAAQLSDSGGAGVWVTGLTAFMCTVIFILSIFKGERDIRLLDWISLGISAIGIVLWFYTNNPLWAVILTTAVDLVGFVPTIRKSLEHPFEETWSTYLMGGIKWVLSVAALSHYSAVTLIYPLGMIVANFGFVLFLLYTRRRHVSVST